MDSVTTTEKRGTLGEVAREFLRLGFVAYGGPAAHVAMMEEHFVRRRNWLTRERFLDLLGAVSLLPGPSSTELAIYLGEIRAGLAGLIVAGACFILPAAFLVIALAWAYLKFGAVPQVAGLLFGFKPVVVALVAQAVWNLGKTVLRNLPLAVLALVVVLLAMAGFPAVSLLIGAGLLWIPLREGKRLAVNRAALGACISLGSGSAGGALSVLPVFLYFLKIGAVLVGSGYVLLPVLRSDLVVNSTGSVIHNCWMPWRSARRRRAHFSQWQRLLDTCWRVGRVQPSQRSECFCLRSFMSALHRDFCRSCANRHWPAHFWMESTRQRWR